MFPETYCMTAHGTTGEISDSKSNLLRNRCSDNITYFGDSDSGGIYGMCLYGWLCSCTYENRGRYRVPYIVTLCLIPLRQGLSMNLDLGWHPKTPMILPPISQTFDGTTCLRLCPASYMVLRS